MKINSKFHCGIKVLLELAKDPDPEGLLQKDISERQNISIKFLDQIISSLRTAGLVYRTGNKRKGKYKLAIDPSKITLYQVYRAFEAELNLNQCVSDGNICMRSTICGARCFLINFNEEMKNYLKSYNVMNLVDHENGNPEALMGKIKQTM